MTSTPTCRTPSPSVDDVGKLHRESSLSPLKPTPAPELKRGDLKASPEKREPRRGHVVSDTEGKETVAAHRVERYRTVFSIDDDCTFEDEPTVKAYLTLLGTPDNQPLSWPHSSERNVGPLTRSETERGKRAAAAVRRGLEILRDVRGSGQGLFLPTTGPAVADKWRKHDWIIAAGLDEAPAHAAYDALDRAFLPPALGQERRNFRSNLIHTNAVFAFDRDRRPDLATVQVTDLAWLFVVKSLYTTSSPMEAFASARMCTKFAFLDEDDVQEVSHEAIPSVRGLRKLSELNNEEGLWKLYMF